MSNEIPNESNESLTPEQQAKLDEWTKKAQNQQKRVESLPAGISWMKNPALRCFIRCVKPTTEGLIW